MLAALLSAWQIDSAVALLRDLPSRQFHPDTCSYNTVMGALAKQPLRGQQFVLPLMGHVYHSHHLGHRHSIDCRCCSNAEY